MKSDDRKPGPSVLYRCACPITILSLLLLAACTVQPEVRYVPDPVRDMNGFNKFHLVEGRILISKQSDKDDKEQAPSVEMDSQVPFSQVVASVVPEESTDHLYAIVPQSRWYHFGLVSTNISSTFYDNTRLVNKLGVEVIDDRVKAIEAVAAVAMVAAMVLFLPENDKKPPEPSLAVPIVINPRDAEENNWEPLGNQPWAYRVTNTAQKIEEDAVSSAEFFKPEVHGVKESATVSTFPVSSCKRIMLELSNYRLEKVKSLLKKKGTEANGNFSQSIRPLLNKEMKKDLDTNPLKRAFFLKIPDPTRVRLLQIPPKGEITTHTLCGANTSMQSSSSANTFDLIGALMKQVQAVFEAQKANDAQKAKDLE